MRNKKHNTISADEEKAFDDIPHIFMLATLHKLGMEGTQLKIIKATCSKLTAS